MLVNGALTVYVERGGKTLLVWPATPDEAVDPDDPRVGEALGALAEAAGAGALGTLTVERINGAPALTAPLGPVLEAAGFHATPRGLRLRAQ
ncbi:ATP-dependent helicase Lhr and Lhr-like helicase [Streptomyces sp. SolWspMP-sol7th]|nr:ATP-dependent helicase Lhr and Lhr-like helicase [Streptomyces sp. SolWspMP-sol7th]